MAIITISRQMGSLGDEIAVDAGRYRTAIIQPEFDIHFSFE